MKRRILAGLLLVMAGVSTTYGQGPTSAGLVLKSQPPGAQATLTGEAVVSGITPVHFRQMLIGDYEVKLEKYGYETYTTRVVLDPSRQTTLDVKMAKKTRFKAGLRSLFIPGWGQWYTDQKTKASVLAIFIAASGVTYFFVDEWFDDRHDRYLDLKAEFDRETDINELRRREDALIEAQRKAYDAETVRRITIGVGLALWAYNFLDVIFFFPEDRGTFSVKGLTMEPTFSTDEVGFTITTDF